MYADTHRNGNYGRYYNLILKYSLIIAVCKLPFSQLNSQIEWAAVKHAMPLILSLLAVVSSAKQWVVAPMSMGRPGKRLASNGSPEVQYTDGHDGDVRVQASELSFTKGRKVLAPGKPRIKMKIKKEI